MHTGHSRHLAYFSLLLSGLLRIPDEISIWYTFENVASETESVRESTRGPRSRETESVEGDVVAIGGASGSVGEAYWGWLVVRRRSVSLLWHDVPPTLERNFVRATFPYSTQDTSLEKFQEEVRMYYLNSHSYYEK